jgi:DNA-binding NarL/FixJ family response regulator
MENNWIIFRNELMQKSSTLTSVVPTQGRSAKFSDRQLSVLEAMEQNLTNRQIAYRLHVSESTIGKETVRIFKLLGALNRRQAVEIAQSMGFLGPIEASIPLEQEGSG